ncbi:MAG: hypothetical protein JOY69_10700, partial [Candidatus Eremiobacteraeota bacterium]|nr:hypothetical protein [Candidatus Eremiobacteraeota bacterium]
MRRLVVVAISLMLAACGGGGAGGGGTPAIPQPTPDPTPVPAGPIKHVVVIVQENRSFDNLFAGFPHADAPTTGKTSSGQTVPLTKVELESNGQYGHGVDIAHGHPTWETEYNGGNMNGFDKATFDDGQPAGLYPYAYVDRSEITEYWNLAAKYTLADHMFVDVSSGSFTSHLDLIAATTYLDANTSVMDYPNNVPWGCDGKSGERSTIMIKPSDLKVFGGPFPCFDAFPTLADSLDANKVSWRYYSPAVTGPTHDPGGWVWSTFDAIKKVRYGKDWANVISPSSTVLSDISAGKLPQMSWVIPDEADSD